MSTLQNIPVKTITGEPSSLQAFAGKVVLVVNVASKCGLTKQYDALEKLFETYRDRGFVVAGFPSNDFAGQEPGSNAEIAEFCRATFSVAFPLFEKISVAGPQKHPLYAALTTAKPQAVGDKDGFRENLKKHGLSPNPDPEVLWNFEKFLVGKNGEVIERFAPHLTPDDPAIVSAVEKALA
ncbi:MAG: glutathione peroxidase [Polyangiales bacterium]